jgi:hypothetical protein
VPSYRSGPVVEIIETRAGLQKVRVDLGGDAPERAYVLCQLIGEVEIGDDVVVNTTAVELDLGTGGWHFVHWNLSRRTWSEPGSGHIMKLRYTSLQVDSGSAEEHHPELGETTSIAGLTVVASALHSQLAGIAVGARHARPTARIVYVMTDASALPLALSDLVARLRVTGLLDSTITAGHAFGGDHEAVSLASALVIARDLVHADVAIVGMGPGIVGTDTALGHGGVELASILDTTGALGGRAIATVRASNGDSRARHRGISHHTITALARLTSRRAEIAIPRPAARELRPELEAAGIHERHDLVDVSVPDVLGLFDQHALHVSSMGRAAVDDPILHECAAAAGILATAP